MISVIKSLMLQDWPRLFQHMFCLTPAVGPAMRKPLFVLLFTLLAVAAAPAPRQSETTDDTTGTAFAFLLALIDAGIAIALVYHKRASIWAALKPYIPEFCMAPPCFTQQRKVQSPPVNNHIISQRSPTLLQLKNLPDHRVLQKDSALLVNLKVLASRRQELDREFFLLGEYVKQHLAPQQTTFVAKREEHKPHNRYIDIGGS